MEINRRHFLTLSACGISGFSHRAFADREQQGWIATSGKGEDGQYYAVMLDAMRDRLIWKRPLPSRGHGMAYHASSGALTHFARRPGLYMEQRNPSAGFVTQSIASPAGRHFYGHGVYASRGTGLFCPENDFETGQGVIAYYDLINEIRHEWASGAIGPHEIAMMPDHRHLVIAHGGIRTHPEKWRKKLNIPDMKPELTLWSLAQKAPIRQITLPAEFHQASIRHLSVRADGLIVFVMQYEGDRDDSVPLIGLFHPDWAEPKLLAPPFPRDIAMQHYCGSVTFSRMGHHFAVSCPRGDHMQIWRLTDRGAEFVSAYDIPDICGLAMDVAGDGFYASSGFGRFYHVGSGGQPAVRLENLSAQALAYDNHMLALTS